MVQGPSVVFGDGVGEVAHPNLLEPMRGNLLPGVDLVEPDGVPALVGFLVSDDARYITGVEHRVEVGFLLR